VIEPKTVERAGHVACMVQEEHAPMILEHKSGKDCCSDSRNTIFKALISVHRMRAMIRHRTGGVGGWRLVAKKLMEIHQEQQKVSYADKEINNCLKMRFDLQHVTSSNVVSFVDYAHVRGILINKKVKLSL
jgi:hypothetical protein